MPIINTEYRREITAKLVDALKNGTAPWQQPWKNELAPVNAVTGRRYNGMNSILLSMEGGRLSNNGDPRWMTAKQAGRKHWLVKSGAKPVTLVCIFFAKPNENDDTFVLEPNCPIRRIYQLYHASQIKGIPEYRIRNRDTIIINNHVIDKILYNASARVYEGGDEAFYSPNADIIQIPSKRYFTDTEAYYSTLLHELVHWTGHHSRLDRGFYNHNSKEYAREELVAEIASMFLTAELGVVQTQEHFEQHAAYVNSWIKMLKSNPNEIFNAANEARKAANYILKFREDIEIRFAS